MEKKINIAELLKDCPKGMELDCTLYDNCTFEGIEDVGYIDILVKTPSGRIRLTKEGCYIRHDDYSKCVIFPKGKTTWEGFHRPFEDGDILTYTSNHTTTFIYRNKDNEPNFSTSFYVACNNAPSNNFLIYNKSTLIALNENRDVRLATEEEKQKLFDAIKANGYRWNAETKALEKLIEPKFKVGDRIKYKNGRDKNGVEECIILSITDDTYDVAVTNDMGIFIPVTDQDNWELVPNKFDINNLKPFDKVLVRDCAGLWRPNLFGKDMIIGYRYFTANGSYKECIPYEGNEHLLGTTDNCDDFYKNW